MLFSDEGREIVPKGEGTTISPRPIRPGRSSPGYIPQIRDVHDRDPARCREERRILVAGDADNQGELANENQVRVGDIVGLPRSGDDADGHERLFVEPSLDIMGSEDRMPPQKVYSS